jgi:hypothetical protein
MHTIYQALLLVLFVALATLQEADCSGGKRKRTSSAGSRSGGAAGGGVTGGEEGSL